MPIARNWFYMIGIMPASKDNIVDKLRNKDHVSILAKLSICLISFYLGGGTGKCFSTCNGEYGCARYVILMS